MSAELTAVAMLALLSQKGVGRRRVLTMINRPLVETDADAAWEEFLERVHSGNRKPIPEEALRAEWAQSVERLHRDDERGIQTISRWDDRYPVRLRGIPDAPAVLFVAGEVAATQAPRTIAIVGTRQPTPFGAKSAYRCAARAVEAGFVVVSGLAHGCDTQAHLACTEANGIGVAVLAHGLDSVYPVANQSLAKGLVAGGGCLMSEYPVGTAPSRWTFTDRNRLQSGLADVVLVIETGVRGGTMYTVQHARRQHRRVACVEHPERHRSASATQGNRELIEQRQVTPIPDGAALQRLLAEAGTGAGSDAEPVRKSAKLEPEE